MSLAACLPARNPLPYGTPTSVPGGSAGSELRTAVLQKVPTHGATWPRVYTKETRGVRAGRVQRGCNTSVHVSARTLG
jgi:hypothetical protein